MVDLQISSGLLAWADSFWKALGPLLGVIVGAILARSWDRQKWINDSKKHEYCELLESLHHNFQILVDTHELKETDEQKNDEYWESFDLAKITIASRIFIASELRQIHFSNLWHEALNQLDQGHVKESETAFKKMSEAVVTKATSMVDDGPFSYFRCIFRRISGG